MSFTVLGLLIMPFVDIMLKLDALVHFLVSPLFCKVNKRTIRQRIINWEEKLFEKMFNLNSFELDNFEKQKKYTQVLFEDTLMFMLQVGIGTGFLRVPRINDPKYNKDNNGFTILVVSGLVTVWSIVQTAFSMIIESKGLKEKKIQYIMLSLKAKSDWVPFGYKLSKQ